MKVRKEHIIELTEQKLSLRLSDGFNNFLVFSLDLYCDKPKYCVISKNESVTTKKLIKAIVKANEGDDYNSHPKT